MEKYGGTAQDFTISTYPSGGQKTVGTCRVCRERKAVQSQKNPICWGCREREKHGKSGPVKRENKSHAVTAFTIDLGGYPAVVAAINERATEEFRTIEGQIAWELVQLFG